MKGPGKKILTEAQEIAKAEGAIIKTRLEEGEAFKKIIDVAEEEGCDLIMTGRRGITRLERALMGSVTERVIGHTPCPVMVVRK